MFEDKEIKNIKDACRIYDLTVDQIYDVINSSEIEKFDPYLLMAGCPQQILRILSCGSTSIEALIKFMGMFGLQYWRDPNFRAITEDCKFLFTDKDYIGAYPSFDECATAACLYKIQPNKTLFLSMYPRIINGR